MVIANKKSILILVTLVLVDQLSKLIVFSNNISMDFKIFAINIVRNNGAVWGLFKDSNTIFVWISLIAIGVLIYAHQQIPEKACVFYVLLFGGIIGNLIDRVFMGFVIDFIDFKIWPVFNFADAYITIGVIGMIVLMWREK